LQVNQWFDDKIEKSNATMIRFSIIVGVFITFALSLPSCPAFGASVPSLMCEEGVYSKVASRPPGDGRTAMVTEFPSPDGLMKIIVKEKPRSQPEVFVSVAGKEYEILFSPWPCPEFQWAPDSKAFFLTYSEGGAVGNYEVRVYYPSEREVRQLDPTPIVAKDFLAHYPKCFYPETPNFGAITWLKDSSRLLVAAEVLPHSNCDMMGTFAAYEIEIPSGQIIKKYGQLEAKKLFGSLLGTELRNADDDCFTKPGSCDIPMLHSK
jgi:hypothetical protein